MQSYVNITSGKKKGRTKETGWLLEEQQLSEKKSRHLSSHYRGSEHQCFLHSPFPQWKLCALLDDKNNGNYYAYLTKTSGFSRSCLIYVQTFCLLQIPTTISANVTKSERKQSFSSTHPPHKLNFSHSFRKVSVTSLCALINQIIQTLIFI